MSLRSFLQRQRQFILYGLIGMAGATLDFVVYSTLLRAGLVNYQAANAIGYACGGVLSFVLNARFNFQTHDRLLLRFSLFALAALLGWACSAALLFVAVQWLALNQYLAKVLTIFVVVAIQYGFNRNFSFKRFEPLRNVEN